jgi:tRNA pseudouridine55 synthase
MVERQPRTVRIHRLELVSFEVAPGGTASARIEVRCGKGTYVRTLAADLGRRLGVPAHLSALRRTAAGPFALGEALPLERAEALGRDDPGALRTRLVPLADALSHLPAVQLERGEVDDLTHGRVLRRLPPGPLCRALDSGGRLVAVCAPDASGKCLRPVRVMAQPRDSTGEGARKR